MTFKCPHCGKGVIESNDRDDGAGKGDLVIKSRLVFLNDDGNVLARCAECKKVIALPLNFSEKTNSLQVKPLIDS